MMRFHKSGLLVLVAMAFLFQAARAQDEDAVLSDKIAVKAARIITVADEEIENGVILIENGRIKDVGKDLEIPYDFWVVDA